MLQPKKTKFRRQQKGRQKGNAQRGNQLAFGSFGIKALETKWITGRQIEAARIAAVSYTHLMPGSLGKKIGMTSVFSADGKNVPCTVIEAGPCVVTQVKTVEKDGYEAVQLGFQDKKEKHTTKPLMGHFKRAGVTPKRHLAEFKEFETELNLGDTVTVSYTHLDVYKRQVWMKCLIAV